MNTQKVFCLLVFFLSFSALSASRTFGDSGGWGHVRGQKGTDIAVGGDGSVWLVGKDARPAGHSIYRWAGAHNWQKVTGQATRIAVGPDGTVWVVNALGDIYKGGCPGLGTDSRAKR